MSVEIAVKKEFESPEYFGSSGAMQLNKKAKTTLNDKTVHLGKKSKSLSNNSLNSKDLKSFENILSDKIAENKNIKKQDIKNLAEIAAAENVKAEKQIKKSLSDKINIANDSDNNSVKDKTKNIKQDDAVNNFFPGHSFMKAESVSKISFENLENAELGSDKTAVKEKSSFAKNILSQLFEKNSEGKNIFNLLSYYANQNNGIERNINLKENNLKNEKEKKEFFKIVDLRKSSNAKKAELSKLSSEKETSEISQSNKFTLSNNNLNSDNAELKELSSNSQVQLTSGKFQQLDSSLISSRQGSPVFHSQFIDYLRENGNTEIVKNANIILKEDNAGEIRLLMKPESLGYVRIKLLLEDNNIAGKIIVDNNSVKEIFENNIENLIKNFKESGYASATIDVSVGGEQNSKERQPVENERIHALKEIEKIDQHTVVRNMLAENRLVDMVI